MKLISVTRNTSKMNPEKFVAIFEKDDGKKIIRKFGVRDSLSYIDGASEKIRDAYRSRHEKDIANPDPASRGNLSFFLSWGDSRNLETNIREYKKRFNV
jgi:hypothetical protein